jgi:glycosyltransferase involved in cell wall biosynthesis
MNAPPLFIVPSIATGGAELLLMLQLAGLRRRGLEPRLIILSGRVEPEILARASLPPEHVVTLGLPSAVLDKAFLRGCPGALGRAARFAAAEGCDRAVALLPSAHVFARLLKLALLARFRQLRLIQYHHSEENALSPRDTFAKRCFHAVNRLLCRICDHAHWHVSEQVRADIASYMPTRRDAVLFNTCDMDTPSDATAARALLDGAGCGFGYTVLLPGRLHSVKGHALLIAAVRRLIADEGLTPDDFRVVFAGDGPERSQIVEAVTEAGLGDYVTLLGSVSHATLHALYGNADVVVVPSLSEGFGNAAIEALSRGALLIASDAGGLAEIVRPELNALQFPAGDETALAALLARVWACRGEGLIDRSGLHAEMAERFGIEHHLDRMLALLGEAGQ